MKIIQLNQHAYTVILKKTPLSKTIGRYLGVCLITIAAAGAVATHPTKIISPHFANVEAAVKVEPTLTPKQLTKWEHFKKKAEELAPIYDYPAKVIISQAALESTRGTSKYAVERNNYFGFACYDADPDANCAYFQNQEQGIIEYMRLIKNRYPKAYSSRKNPEKMIELIKEGGYATDPNYVAKIKGLKEWKSI
jgi:flagellum-specific peptidoglycan hydrolase FlgJ